MKHRKRTGKGSLSFVMALMIVVGMVSGIMPGTFMTALAADDYTALIPAEGDDEDALGSKVVKFNGYDWYIITDNSTAMNAGTVTLFAKDPVAWSEFADSGNAYSSSAVKSILDAMTEPGGGFADVAVAINSVSLPDVAVTDAKLYLLSTREAESLPECVLLCSPLPESLNESGVEGLFAWWLRTPGIVDGYDDGKAAAAVFGNNGDMKYAFVHDAGFFLDSEMYIRPALQLNLESVAFVSESKTFSLKSGGNNTNPTPDPEPISVSELAPHLEKDENGGLVCYVNGQRNDSYSGYADYNKSKFFVTNGKVDTTVNGVKIDGSANPLVWYFCANGQVQTQHVGLAEYDGEWFYVENGKVAVEMNKFVEYNGGLFAVAAGRIVSEYSGLMQDPENPVNGDWYFFANGQAQTQYTGLAMYDNAWFYVVNGKLAVDYTGTVDYDGATFDVENGMVK